jgi:hypothetical protein
MAGLKKRKNPFSDLQDIDIDTGSNDDADPESNRISTRGRKKQAPKRKPTELTQVTSSQTSAQTQAFLFVAVIDCAVLNPHWGEGYGANRAIIPSHVGKLLVSFEAEHIRRFDPDCRMKASVTLATSKKILDRLTDTQRETARTAHRGAGYLDYVHIEWDSKAWGRPTLEAGQHRRAAIMQMNGLDPLRDVKGVEGSGESEEKVVISSSLFSSFF